MSRWDAPAPGGNAAPSGPTPNATAAAQAAAIAAKIAASLPAGTHGSALIKKSEDEGFVRDIEINDLRNRYVLTKGPTQKKIEEETGASVTTKGVWVPDRTKLAPGEVPLFIHVTSKSMISLEKAVEKIHELINQELGPLLDERTMVARNRALGLPMPEGFGQKDRTREKWPEDKLFIGLDSLRNFNIRAKIVGPGGMFVKYIQAETGCRVQIKGLGSGFMENETGREAEEPMHISMAAPTEDQVARAKALAEDLLVVLRIEYAKARGDTGGGGYGGGYQQQAYGQDQGQYAGYYQQQPEAAPAAAAAAAPGATPAQGSDAWAQYAAYWAAYGYDVNDPQFQAWQATQVQGGEAPATS